MKENFERAMTRMISRRKITEAGCWEYQGSTSGTGHGCIKVVGRKNMFTHRISWTLANGRMPQVGMVICHRCDNPRCFNPEHLYEGTKSQNAKDAVERLGMRNPVHKGERNHFSKIKESDVLEILKLRASGLMYKEIALKFGISPGQVGAISRGEKWSHLTNSIKAAEGK